MSKSQAGVSELRQARSSGIFLLWAVSIFSIFVNLLMLTGPLFMLQVYDRVLGSRSEETLVALFALVAVLYGLMTFLEYSRGRILARFGARFQSQLDGRVFAAVMRRAQLPDDKSAQASGLRDLEAVRTLFTSPVMVALFDIPWTPLFIAAIFVFHPLLGWMAIFGSVVLILITLSNNLLTREKTKEAQVASLRAHSLAEQARRSAELVRAQGMNWAMATRWHELRDSALKLSIRSNDWTGVFVSTGKSFRLLLQAMMLALGAYLVLQNEVTGGAMIASSILLGRALEPVQLALGHWVVVQQARTGWCALCNLLETTPIQEACHALPRPEANISCSRVSVVMTGAKAPALAGVSFYVGAGEVLGVIGKSGSGKSTLAKSLLGLNTLTAGEIRFGGATLDQYDPDDLGSYIGYLPQNIVLFSGTIGENIARMSVNPNQKKVLEAANRANAHEMILQLPDGYNTIIQGDDPHLSGGQCQRIALARAFYGNPVLLILDEPNSALDSDGSAALNSAVHHFKAECRSVIIMTHRPSALSECDRLLVIEGGRIKKEGPRDAVFKSMVSNVKSIEQSMAESKAS